MVTFTDHRFSLAGMGYNPGKASAYINPTVFSGLKVAYGADTCTDHPSPSTMAGRVFIPESMAAFYPDLNDPVSYFTGGPGGMAYVFRGRVESLTIEEVKGFTAPARFPNSRNMATLTPSLAASRWNFYTSAYEVPAVPSAGALTDSPHRVQAWPAPLATEQPPAVAIVTPYAPVEAGQAYSFVAHVLERGGGISPIFEWYSSTTAGGLIRSEYATVPPLGTLDNDWYALATESLQAPPGARFVRVRVQLSPVDTGPHAGSVMMDTITLLTAAEKKKRPPGLWVDFEAADITAMASRLMVSDTPWPVETTTSRVVRLSQLVPRNVMTFGTDPIDYTELSYRDVDNQSAMGIFQRICSSIGAVALASPEYEKYITTGRPPRSPYSLEMVNGRPEIVDDADLVKIPAGSIMDGPLATSITGMSNQVNFSYRSWLAGGSEDATALIQNEDSIAVYGPMARSVETDLPAPLGKAWDQAQYVATAQARPVYRLDGATKVIVSELAETPASWDLFNAVEGFRRLVHVPDAPARIGHYHRIASAEMIFGKDPEMTLKLEPANLIPAEAVTLYDIGRWPYNNVPISAFTHLTFDQLANASSSAQQ